MRLRPHHLLCLLAFGGRGYSPAFIAVMRDLQGRYLDGELVELTAGADEVCAACPRRGPDGGCQSPPGVQPEVLDARVAEALGLEPWRLLDLEALRPLLQALPPGRLAALCEGCSWRDEAGCPEKVRRAF